MTFQKLGNKLTELRSKKSTPLVFELPAPGSQKGVVTGPANKYFEFNPHIPHLIEISYESCICKKPLSG